jgi:hypothetical protein
MPTHDPFFDYDVAKGIVKRALKEVADFKGNDIENFTFRRFKSFLLFVSALQTGIRSVRRDERRYYNIRFDDDMINQWVTVGDCIKWVLRKKGLRVSSTKKLSRSELEE